MENIVRVKVSERIEFKRKHSLCNITYNDMLILL